MKEKAIFLKKSGTLRSYGRHIGSGFGAGPKRAVLGIIVFHEKNNNDIGIWYDSPCGTPSSFPKEVLCMFDVLLKHCRIVDGTGAPWFRADVGISGDRIAVVRRELTGDASVTLDIGDRILCPGFIDMHTHSDLRVFTQPGEDAKIMQGITTGLVGQDGLSVAPLSPGARPMMRTRLLGLDGRYDAEWEWSGSMGAYLDAIDRVRPAANTAALVAHGAVRASVVGWDDRPATEDEIRRMTELVGAAMAEGAFGFSTGLVYPPCLFAEEREFVALAAETARHGGFFVVHMRNEADHIVQSLREVIGICTKAGCPLHVSHLKIAGKRNHGRAGEILDVIDAARAGGLDVTFDQYPYTAGSTMLDALIPPPFHAEGQIRMLELIKDPSVRGKIRDIQKGKTDLLWENWVDSCGWDGVLINAVRSDANRWTEGKMLAEIAATSGKDPVDALCDLLVEEEGNATMTLFYGCEDDVRTILSHEAMTFCSDSIVGGKPHPRTYGSTAKILGQYLRREGILSLPQAIRRMTSAPAARLGLQRRGVIREGAIADLVAFSPDDVLETGTYRDPVSYPNGFFAVMTSGEIVMRDGSLTGRRPGRALRRNDTTR